MPPRGRMPGADRRAKLLREYRDHLTVALLISLAFLPFLLRSGLWPALALSTFATLVFGSCFFLLNLVRNRIRLSLFSLNLIVQPLLIALTVFVGALLTGWAGLATATRRSPLDEELLRTGAGFITTRVTPLALAGGILLAGAGEAHFLGVRQLGPGGLRHSVTAEGSNPQEGEGDFIFFSLRRPTTLGAGPR